MGFPESSGVEFRVLSYSSQSEYRMNKQQQRLSPHIYCSLVGITALIIDEDYATPLVNRRGVVNIRSGYCHLSNSGFKNEVRLKGRVRAGKW
jgi:hypothetical protein